VIGGSSAVNATIALRGVPADYDEWAALGNDEWDRAKVLPHFRGLGLETTRKGRVNCTGAAARCPFLGLSPPGLPESPTITTRRRPAYARS